MLLAVVCFAFISMLIICSASWVIKNFFEDNILKTNVITDNTVYIDDKKVVPDTSDYFKEADSIVYDGNSHIPRITSDGAKKLFGHFRGDMTEDEFAEQLCAADPLNNDYYNVTWEGGKYFNGDPIPTAEAYKHYRDVIAGTHYYRITDKKTGTVLCYKHAVSIAQDKLKPAQVTASEPYFVGDTVTYELKWEGDKSKITYSLGTLPDTIKESYFTPGASRNTTQTYSADITKYTSQWTAENENFKLFKNNYSNATSTADGDKSTFTYDILGTCYIGNKIYYGTVCQAIDAAVSGNKIYVEASFTYPATNGKTYTAAHTKADGEKSFKHKICHDCTLVSGAELIVAYSGTFYGSDKLESMRTGSSTNVYAYKTPATYCKNQVEISAKLTVNGTITVGGVYNPGASGALSAGQTCGEYAQMELKTGGKIEVNTGTVNCFGFIVGTSSVEDIVFNSGSTLMMPFILYEFRGGSISMATQKEDDTFYATPFIRFAFQNIDGAYRIKYGATAKAKASLYASSSAASADADVIASSGTPLVKLSAGSYVDIDYRSEESIDTYCGKMYLKFYGGATLNSLVISKRILLMTITVSSKGAYLPISYLYDIELVSGSFDLAGQNIKILPGASVTVGKNATVTAANIISYETAPPLGAAYSKIKYPTTYVDEAGKTQDLPGGNLTINGSLTVNNIGGYIDTVSKDATLIINNAAKVEDSKDLLDKSTANTTTPDQTMLDQGYEYSYYEAGLFGGTDYVVYYSTTKLDATGMIAYKGAPIDNFNFKDTNFVAGKEYTSYVCATDADGKATDWAWAYSNDVTISYESNGGSAVASKVVPTEVWSNGDGFVLTDEYLPTTSTKQYYDFVGWYIDEALTIPAKTEDGYVAVYDNTTLYAKWTPTKYTATFINVYPDGSTSTRETKDFDVESTVSISQSIVDSSGKYNFNGWYKDLACSSRHTEGTISGAELLANGKVLYAQWISEKTYTVKYNSTYHSDSVGGEATVSETDVDNKTALRKPNTDYKDDTGEQYYFNGWTYNGVAVTDFSFIPSDAANGTTFDLEAVWIKKDYTLTTDGSLTAGDNNSAITLDHKPLYFVESQLTNGVTLSDLLASLEQKAKGGDATNTIDKYFAGWAKANGTIVTSISVGDFTDGALKLTATWGTKASVALGTISNATVKLNDVQMKSTDKYYYKPSDSFTIGITFTQSSNKSWSITDGTNSLYSGTKDANQSVTMGTVNLIVNASSEEDSGACFAPGTLITLADGTQKKIEDITYDDLLLVWDFNTGTKVSKPASILINMGEGYYSVVNLIFSDGTEIKMLDIHGFFDLDENKYVFINADNVENYIGHRFVKVTDTGYEIVTLTTYSLAREHTVAYSILSAEYYNVFAEGILTVTPLPGINNNAFYDCWIFDEDLTYDKEAMQTLVDKHGLFTHEDFIEYGITYEQFVGLNLAYVKVIIGEGAITMEEALQIMEAFVPSA